MYVKMVSIVRTITLKQLFYQIWTSMGSILAVTHFVAHYPKNRPNIVDALMFFTIIFFFFLKVVSWTNRLLIHKFTTTFSNHFDQFLPFKTI